MSPSRLPLPLELTEPFLLAGDLDTLVRDGLSSSEYDPKTQLCGSSGCSSEMYCESTTELLSVDTQYDGIQIDDIDIL